MLKEVLTELKMYGAIEVLEKLDATIDDKEQFAISILQAEREYKKAKAIKRKLSQAKFTKIKEWQEIDGELNPKIDFKSLQKHSLGKFVDENKNLCFMGNPGTGKTHSIISIGRDLENLSEDQQIDKMVETFVNFIQLIRPKNQWTALDGLDDLPGGEYMIQAEPILKKIKGDEVRACQFLRQQIQLVLDDQIPTDFNVANV